MSDFDFAQAQKNITAINSIVASCPEPLREKCFELLFHEVFQGQAKTLPKPNARTQQEEKEKDKGTAGNDAEESPTDFKLPSNIAAFLRKFGIQRTQLEKLFMLDHQPLLPVYRITTANTRHGQLQKVMMVFLETCLSTNQMKLAYTELRDACKEGGHHDSNFNKALKKNHDLFKSGITEDRIDEDVVVELSAAGYDKLAEVVKELTGAAA